MRKLVGGQDLTAKVAVGIAKYLNSIDKKVCKYYRFGSDKKGDIFLMYGNDKSITVNTFFDATRKDVDIYEPNVVPNQVSNGLVVKKIGGAQLSVAKRKKELYLVYIETQEEFENQGIGSEVLKLIESYCVKNGLRRISLECINCYVSGGVKYRQLGRKEDKKQLKSLLKSKKLVNKNVNFYLKNRYQLSVNTNSAFDYFTPMVKSNLRYFKPSIDSLKELVESEIKRLTTYPNTKCTNKQNVSMSAVPKITIKNRTIKTTTQKSSTENNTKVSTKKLCQNSSKATRIQKTINNIKQNNISTSKSQNKKVSQNIKDSQTKQIVPVVTNSNSTNKKSNSVSDKAKLNNHKLDIQHTAL